MSVIKGKADLFFIVLVNCKLGKSFVKLIMLLKSRLRDWKYRRTCGDSAREVDDIVPLHYVQKTATNERSLIIMEDKQNQQHSKSIFHNAH